MTLSFLFIIDNLMQYKRENEDFTLRFFRYEASVEKSLFLGNATQVTHRPLAIEIVGLPGGHNYDVWIEACVEDECQAGKSKVVTIMCEHKCSDGTCLHWNAKCNYVRECPDGSDEQVNIR